MELAMIAAITKAPRGNNTAAFLCNP
ncbi:uncharacterized protein METZ01_LOCUS11404, partial [marine metagenome]